jgi:hypothetical protein
MKFRLCALLLLSVGLTLPAAPPGGLSPDDFGVTTLTPPVLNTDPGPKYWPRMRMWQGIPSIERTAKGRLWATWYAGPLSEGSGGNHALLVTSGDDGQTWSHPVAVYDPTTFFDGSTGDPNLWLDPQGRLWWFVFRILKVKHPDGIRSRWGFCCENPNDPWPKWNAPVFAGFGIGLNKPTVLSNGDWLRPIDNNAESKQGTRTQFYVSHDQGRSFSLLSKLPIKDVSFAEHMAVERKDGSLLMMARTSYGIAQAESLDHGASWVNERPFTRDFGVNTRFFLRKLKSGARLLVINDVPRGRNKLTALLSEDDGRTWPHKLLLDERERVSYPDGTEGRDGFLYVTYDRGRYEKDEQEILFAKFSEADIKAGRVVTEGSRLKQLINRLSDHEGGVHKTREPQLMEEEFAKEKGRPVK